MKLSIVMVAFLMGACADAEPAQPAPSAAPVETTPTAQASPEPVQLETEEPKTVDLVGVLAQGGFARGQVRGGDFRAVYLDGEQIPVLDDGRFFIAFGRDAPSEATLAVVYADGDEYSQAFTLADTRFPESRLPARTTTDIEESPNFRARRDAELQRIRAARASASNLTGWSERFRKPVEAPISSRFGAQRFYGDVARNPHGGTDFAAPPGTPVVAPSSGQVVLAVRDFSYEGNLVIVDHGLGLYSAFLHLAEISVAEGDILDQGVPIGTVGSSGRATGPHLHWGLWWNGVRFDPQAILAR